jgi:hypothetical protein
MRLWQLYLEINMKYRIKEENGKFIPQSRFFGFWFDFTNLWDITIEFDSFAKAACFISAKIKFKKHLEKQKPKYFYLINNTWCENGDALDNLNPPLQMS